MERGIGTVQLLLALIEHFARLEAPLHQRAGTVQFLLRK